MNPYILVIDLGTTNTKAVLYNAEGDLLSNAQEPTPTMRHDLACEIDVDKLWNVVKRICLACSCNIDRESIAAISISSQSNSLVALDNTGAPLHYAISWDDERPLPYMELYSREFQQGKQIKNCGQYPLPQYAPFKIQWFAKNYPELSEKVWKWVNVSDYIYYKLTGNDAFYTDYSIASRTLLFDVKKNMWNLHATEYFGVDDSLFAKPQPSGTIIGNLGLEMRKEGFSKNTSVVLGGHDHMCAFVGANVTSPRDILDSTGTSEAIETIIDDPVELVPEEIASRWMNLENSLILGKVALVKYVSASGKLYQSTKETFIDCGGNVSNPSRDIIFIPPKRAMLASVKGVLQGIPDSFNHLSMARALRDGTLFECRRCIEQVKTVAHCADTTIRVVGGHTKDLQEMQIKSNVMGTTLDICAEPNIAARGAFIVAATACNMYPSLSDAMYQMYKKLVVLQIEPDKVRASLYDEIYREKYLPYFKNGLYSL